MSVSELFGWVEDHPILTAVLGITGLLIILWLLGVFSSSKASEGGQSNMAAAYYAAEAAQAAAGAQIQTTQIQATAATSIAARNAQMQEALGAISAGAATTINAQNTGAAMTINQQNTGAAIAIDAAGNYTQQILSNDQLQATRDTNYWAAQTSFANNATARDIAIHADRTSVYNSFLNNILPLEIAQGHFDTVYQLQDQQVFTAGTVPDFNWMRSQGFSEAQIAQIQSRW